MAFEFRCPLCKARVADTDVDLVRGRVTCPRCRAVFRSAEPSGPASPRGPVPLPRGMAARETGRALFIAVRWFRPLRLFVVGGAVAVDLVLLMFFGEFAAVKAHWTTYLFAPMTYLVLGIGLNYWALAILLNRTHVRVEDGRIRVSHVPLPCSRFKRIEAADVDQLFTRAEYDKQGRIECCHVCVLRRDGRWLTLVKNLATIDQALFLEWAIERHLGVRDRPVAGEVPR